MSLRSILLTAVVIVIVWLWQNNRRYKDRALRAAAHYCEQLSLRLLDDTVVLKRMRPQRNAHGNWLLARRYVFDFSSVGGQRYQGEVVMLGSKIERIQLEPHRVD